MIELALTPAPAVAPTGRAKPTPDDSVAAFEPERPIEETSSADKPADADPIAAVAEAPDTQAAKEPTSGDELALSPQEKSTPVADSISVIEEAAQPASNVPAVTVLPLSASDGAQTTAATQLDAAVTTPSNLAPAAITSTPDNNTPVAPVSSPNSEAESAPVVATPPTAHTTATDEPPQTQPKIAAVAEAAARPPAASAAPSAALSAAAAQNTATPTAAIDGAPTNVGDGDASDLTGEQSLPDEGEVLAPALAAKPRAATADSAKPSSNKTTTANTPTTAGATATAAVQAATPDALAPNLADASRLAGSDPALLDAASSQPDVTLEGASDIRSAARAEAALRTEASGPRVDAASLAALAVRMAKRAADGATRFELRLDPPELGRVDVRLDVETDGAARAHLSVERPEALAELSRHARALERALAEAGLEMGEGSIEFSLAEDGAFSGEPEADGEGGGQNASHTANETEANPPAPAELAEVDSVYGYSVLRLGRLDVQV